MKNKMLETLGYVVNAGSIALLFYLATLMENLHVPPALNVLGWIAFVLGVILVVLSMLTLLSNRETGLIERGVYGIVRHPMYVGAILLFLCWVCFMPHWITALIVLVNIPIIYAFMLQGERFNLSKFGDVYSRYMERVPRLDLFTGMIRYLRRK